MLIRSGDVALITGASRGLGRHIALALARKGANLVLAARGQQGLDAVAEEVRSKTGVTVWTLVVDLADRAQAADLIARAEAAAGHIDILVNNAGIESAGLPEEATLDDLSTICDVNLLAPMVLTRMALPGLVEHGRGHIVNVASMAGLMGSPYQESYNATKFGLVGYTKALRLTAQDRGWGISASAVCPGFMAGDGMFADAEHEFGVTTPKAAAALPAERVGKAVVEAIEKDAADVIVMRGPARLMVAASTVLPRSFEKLTRRLGLGTPFRTMAESRSQAGA